MVNELTVKKETSVEEFHAPSLIDSDDVPTDKLLIPRINLLQAMSDPVQLDGFKQGTFHNNVTGQNYGETVRLIPIKVRFGAVYLDNKEGLKCRSMDGVTNVRGEKCAQCPFGVYHQTWVDGEPPACNETVDVMVVEGGSAQPAVLTFRSTSYKEGKRLATNMRLVRQASALRIGCEKKTNDSGTFFVIKVKAMEPLSEAEYGLAKEWKDRLSTTSYVEAEEPAYVAVEEDA